MSGTLDKLLEHKIIAVLRDIPSMRIIPSVQALIDGGIVCVEVTFDARCAERSEDALQSLTLLKQEFGDLIALGAGTVLTVRQARDAASAGAQYIVSPGADQAVIAATKELGLVSVPGAMTPTEILAAWGWGADLVKLFPASALGPDYIRAIRSPIRHIPLLAVGGITAANARSYLDAGCAGLCAGGNLADKDRIEAGDYGAIRELAAAYKAVLSGI